MRKLLAVIPILLLVACTTGSNDSANEVIKQDKAVREGSLVIARSLPEAKTASTGLFGFMPQQQSKNSSHKLILDRESGTISIFKGALKVVSFPAANIEGLKPGTYEVLHKQRRPVWYATDEYFSNRGLPVPAKQARERYLKGALGDFVIYLDDKTPLHNSAVYADEVGGVQMQDNDIAQVYYKLEVGSTIEVQ